MRAFGRSASGTGGLNLAGAPLRLHLAIGLGRNRAAGALWGICRLGLGRLGLGKCGSGTECKTDRGERNAHGILSGHVPKPNKR